VELILSLVLSLDFSSYLFGEKEMQNVVLVAGKGESRGKAFLVFLGVCVCRVSVRVCS
jgi:hypothetical protein